MGIIALPSFLGSPEDATKVVDAYGETSSELRTALSSKIDSFSSGLGDAFDKAVSITKGIGEKIRTNTIDLNSAVKRVQGALKGSRADIIKIASSTEKMIMGELTGTDTSTNYVKTATDVARGAMLMVEDGKQLIDTFKNGGYNQVSAMVGFISDLTDNPNLKLFDLGAEAAILRGVVEEVSAWGIPDLVDKVLKDKTDTTKFTVIKRSAEKISASSSLDVLLAYANVKNADGTQNIGSNALNANTPDFATKVLSNFAFVEGITVADYPSQLTKLVQLMDMLKPDWFWTTRGNERVWNLGTLATSSENAVTLFLSSPDYRDAILTAPFYTPMRVEELVSTMYPLTTTA
ncbi:hypothetical protein [Pseudomonas phage D6]|nr:hypothetical protein [Pseudomonas phage D6]